MVDPLRGPGNVIRGPGGVILGRPSELPTGISSHISFLVREVKEIKEHMKRNVKACREDRRDRDNNDGSRVRLPVLWLPWAFDIFTERVISGNVARGGPGDPSQTTNPGGGF